MSPVINLIHIYIMKNIEFLNTNDYVKKLPNYKKYLIKENSKNITK